MYWVVAWNRPEYALNMAVPHTKSMATFVPSVPLMRGTPIGKALGLKSMETASLMKAVKSGLRWKAVRKFLDVTGLSQQELAKYLTIPERTFARRRETGAFGGRESELVLRLAEICQAAHHLFDGDTAAARIWLTSTARGLGNARPIDFAQSEFGAREVRDLIGRLADGVFS